MSVIPRAFLGTFPVISSQILWMNWWGMTNTSMSASCTASWRFGTATCHGEEEETVTSLPKHAEPSDSFSDPLSDADHVQSTSTVQTDSPGKCRLVLCLPHSQLAPEARRVLPLHVSVSLPVKGVIIILCGLFPVAPPNHFLPFFAPLCSLGGCLLWAVSPGHLALCLLVASAKGGHGQGTRAGTTDRPRCPWATPAWARRRAGMASFYSYTS